MAADDRGAERHELADGSRVGIDQVEVDTRQAGEMLAITPDEAPG
jgi:hypothetical protein